MASQSQDHIRNFAIIAHIDHGKSTLADRLLEITGMVTEREQRAQYLDRMELERERGITIKAQSVSLDYTASDGVTYQLNLIDTPGHVDFNYEVSRSLTACEGALLLVDASQGVEAQTLANAWLAVENDLEILPVLNKIDLPAAEPERVLEEIEQSVGLDIADALMVSAKTGAGVEPLLEAIVAKVPPPVGDPDAPLQALIIDSWFDSYVGVITMIRVVNGRLKKRDRILLMATEATYEVSRVGVFAPEATDRDALSAGEVGFLVAGIKELALARVGDTVTLERHPAAEPLDGFEESRAMVFAGLYPVVSSDHGALRDALEKLRVNDGSFSFEAESSDALGLGFRCGFLGMLHMEIIQERLEREYEVELVTTAPSVVYRAQTKSGEELMIRNPSQLPELNEIAQIEEPIALVAVHTPEDYVGPVLKLCEDRRGVQVGFEYVSTNRVQITYEVPYAEVIFDFFDKLKSSTRGYASMSYDLNRWEASKLVRLDVLLNGDRVDALSIIVHESRSYRRGQGLAKKLKEHIPRQMYDVAIQAAIGNKVIARTTVKAMRKDVTSKCYGGDISRKRKLLERQKAGKKRMKAIGSVEVPQTAFLSVLGLDD